jgi:hypothetical protein
MTFPYEQEFVEAFGDINDFFLENKIRHKYQ